jgi:hypothetical protein
MDPRLLDARALLLFAPLNALDDERLTDGVWAGRVPAPADGDGRAAGCCAGAVGRETPCEGVAGR